MGTRWWKAGSIAAVMAVPLAAAALGGSAEYTVDASASHVVINVGKAGVLGFAGHIHEVVAPSMRGGVTLDVADWPRSAVWLEFNAPALKLTGTGEPASDVPEVQRVMLSDHVLDATRYPLVSFRSKRVLVESPRPDSAKLSIEGTLTLHGVSRPVTVPVVATLDAAGTLTARGKFSIKQSAFGMEPVTAAGGSIRVKDDVDVEFVLKAHR